MHCSSSLILVGLTLAVVSVVPVSVASNDLQQSGRQLLQSEKFQECKAAFDNLGGSEEEVAKKLPACTQTQPVLGDCCSQVGVADTVTAICRLGKLFRCRHYDIRLLLIQQWQLAPPGIISSCFQALSIL